MQNIYEVQSANKRKSALVVFFFAIFIFVAMYFVGQGLFAYMGYEPGGLGFFGLMMIFSGLTTFVSYYASDKIVLAISGARPADRKRDFEFYTVAENLAIGAGLPKPKLYVINDSAPNAFATGRDPDHAVVCATTGLLSKLTRTELEGVIAHELTHIKNYDMRLMSIVSVMVGSLALLADMFMRVSWFGGSRDNDRNSNSSIFIIVGILFAILSPVIASLIKLAISRRREFMADAGAVAITRQPQGLINALIKISSDHEPLEVAHNATAHLYIINPFKANSGQILSNVSNLFNTHPPIEKRVEELKKML